MFHMLRSYSVFHQKSIEFVKRNFSTVGENNVNNTWTPTLWKSLNYSIRIIIKKKTELKTSIPFNLIQSEKKMFSPLFSMLHVPYFRIKFSIIISLRCIMSCTCLNKKLVLRHSECTPTGWFWNAWATQTSTYTPSPQMNYVANSIIQTIYSNVSQKGIYTSSSAVVFVAI